jgi:uncharacterized membrane protein YcaP (DUF421 family)
VERFWGHGQELDPLQMGLRAAVMFVLLLAMIRVGGMRIFGKGSSFDNVVVILLGAVAARGVVGATPFFSAVAAAATIVALHRVVAWLVVHYPRLARALEGERICLYRDGQLQRDNLRRAAICEHELMASLRLETQRTSLDGIADAGLETNGRISFVTRPDRDEPDGAVEAVESSPVNRSGYARKFL